MGIQFVRSQWRIMLGTLKDNAMVSNILRLVVAIGGFTIVQVLVQLFARTLSSSYSMTNTRA